MSRKRKTTRIVKSAAPEGTEAAGEVVSDQLEALAREGAREMLITALGDEVNAHRHPTPAESTRNERTP